MNKNLEAVMTKITGVKFRNAKGVPIIELTLVDAAGEEYRHSLWFDGNNGPDKAIQNVKDSLTFYGWDGKDLKSLATLGGIEEHVNFPQAGIPVVYKEAEFKAGNTMVVINQIRYIVGLGDSILKSEEVDDLEKKLSRLGDSSSSGSVLPDKEDEDMFV